MALLNGAPFAAALGIHLAGRQRVLLEQAHADAALAIELVHASTRPYSRRLGALSRDSAQQRVHERLLELLAGGRAFEDALQAPASFRVVPQVYGAVLGQLETFEARLEAALGAVTDSPLILPAEDGEPAGAYPSGAFHAAAVALALDGLAIGVAQLEPRRERLHRLLDARFSGLPEQLAVDPGRQAGVVSLHKAVVGLAAENRLLAAPASAQAFDTSTGQEDFQAFEFLAADKLAGARQPRARLCLRARGAAAGLPPARRAAAPAAPGAAPREAGNRGRAGRRGSNAHGRRRTRARARSRRIADLATPRERRTRAGCPRRPGARAGTPRDGTACPTSAARVADRLNRAGRARREHAKAGRELGDLVAVILEHDDLVRKPAEEVAVVVDPDREKPVLAARRCPDAASGETRLQLHPRADAEHGPADIEDGLAEPREHFAVRARTRCRRAAQDDAVRGSQPDRVDLFVEPDPHRLTRARATRSRRRSKLAARASVSSDRRSVKTISTATRRA